MSMQLLFIKNLRGKYVPYCWERKRCVELEDTPMPFNARVVQNKELNDVLSGFIVKGRGYPAFATLEVQGDMYLYDPLTPNVLVEELRVAGKKLACKKFDW